MSSTFPPTTRMDPPNLLAAAHTAHTAGLCVLPPREDGSKQPDAPSWTRYQHARSTPAEITAWYARGQRTGIGIVCGPVSGQLELFEFDDAEIFEQFLAVARESGLADLLTRISEGWSETTPGGGTHWYYRLSDTTAKTVALARRPGVDAAGKPRPTPLIETKGAGGYAVIAPSHGRVHPSGRPYRCLAGGPATLAVITADERDALWSLARAFDELPKPEVTPSPPPDGDGPDRWLLRPGDAFTARATWAEVLEPHGWEVARERGEETLWRRPGGYPGGWGASTNYQQTDLLYVWTTAAPPLVPDRAYTKFTVFTLLNHDGDFAAAARALEAQGYGQRRPLLVAPSPSLAPLLPVPPFPVDALPPLARSFVTAGAAALGCPPDFIAPHLFPLLGAVAGNSRKLQLKTGFVVAPIFWVGVIGRPGTVKSPALTYARRPVDLLQREAWNAYRVALETWEEEKASERGAKPRPEHYFATDTTTEAVAFALVTSRGLVVIHDELAGWVGSFDAYRKAGDRQTWLSAWSGSPLKPNRKTGELIYIPDPVVGIAGGIQPDVLPDLAGEAARDDGFLPRQLLAWPDAEPSPWTDSVVAESVVTAMVEIVGDLRLPGEETVVTELSAAAYREWVRWYNENQRLIGTATGLTAGWAAKAPVHLARIAFVLHLLAYPEPRDQSRPLRAGTMRDAITVLEYFRAHLARVLPAFGAASGSGSAGLAPRILRLLDRVAPDWMGRADLAAALGGHEPSTRVGSVLDGLAADGRVERRFRSTPGRGREEWRVTGQGADPDLDDFPPRDKGEDGESPPAGPLSRNHVITPTPEAESARAWERWEESL